MINGKEAIMLRLVTCVLLCTSLGCGPLVYRPKQNAKPAAVGPGNAAGNYKLPPHPDKKANSGTLAGIDTTGIGIRDDVHIWIYTHYTSAKKRTVLKGMAKNLQGLIVNTPKTAEDAKKLQQQLAGELALLKAVPGVRPAEADEIENRLDMQSFDTPARLKAYLDFNLLVEGKRGSR